MSKMTDGYWVAMAKSYDNQEGGITIPADQLDRIVEIQMGAQPLGICARPLQDGSDEVAVAFYFEPAVCLANVRRDAAGLHLVVSHIRGVNHGIQSVRLFPDIYQPGGANRAQCVFWGPDGKTIWVSRNGERDFFVLSPPAEPKGRWTLIDKFSMPQCDPHMMVHSALYHGDVYTIESPDDLKEWRIRQYNTGPQRFVVANEQAIETWRYGIAVKNGSVWTVTDFRADQPHGIYCGDKLMVPDMCGNGIAFLSDGSALVTRYGQSYPGCFNGIPGALIYIPADLLKV